MAMPPEYPIEIVETDVFLEDASCYFTDDERSKMREFLALNPESGDVIPKTNGLRKLRWPLKTRRVGKRRGARVIYYYRNINMPVFMLGMYVKNKKENLTEKDKKGYRELVDMLVREYDEAQYANVLQLVVNNS